MTLPPEAMNLRLLIILYRCSSAAQRILFVPVSDPLLAFENGEIDITSMPIDLMDRYKNDESIGLVEKSNDMGYKMLIRLLKIVRNFSTKNCVLPCTMH